MSVKLKLLPNPKDNSDMFEEETISCPPNMPGLFRYAEQIITTEIPADRGRTFVLEMINLSKKVYLDALQNQEEKNDK